MIEDGDELDTGIRRIWYGSGYQHKIDPGYSPCERCGFVANPGITQYAVESYVETEEEKQREFQFRVHQAHIARDLLATTPIEVLCKRFHVSAIKRQFGQWAVTKHGVECLTRDYDVPRKRLFDKYSWEVHMAEKNWVIMEDFSAAIRHARVIYRQPVNKAMRYRVLERDNFRCCQCGRAAIDGIQLEIGHKRPVATGGASKIDNLFTQCNDCNDGQYTKVAIIPEKHNHNTTQVDLISFESDSCF